MGLTARRLFLKWLLLNALAVVLLLAAGVEYHDRIQGSSLVVIPLILAVGAFASTTAGRLCWVVGNDGFDDNKRVLHEARYLPFWAYTCQMLGILATVIGFWVLLSAGGEGTEIGDRVQEGGGVALLGTFAGVFVSLILVMEHRLIEHDLEA